MTRNRHETPQETPGGPTRLFGIVPPGLLWTVVALMVVAVVWTYDRSAQRTALDHVAMGEVAEEKQDYRGALGEYALALENSRLNKRARASVAIRMARLAEDRLGRPDEAARLLARARDLHPKSVQDPVLQEKMRRLGVRAEGTGRSEVGTGASPRRTTPTLASTSAPPVREAAGLVGPPPSDLEGPALAVMEGMELRAGELVRTMGSLTSYKTVLGEGELGDFERLVNDQSERALLYKAALDAGFGDAPDIHERVYEYQRTLVSERYMAAQKKSASVIPDERVRAFYEEHKERFGQAGSVGLAMIKTGTEEDAQRAYKALEEGTAFADVATSHSIEKVSAARGGLIGGITESDAFVPGLGPQKKLIEAIRTLDTDQYTSPTRVDDAYYIIRVVERTPARTQSFEEARPRIESLMRREAAALTPRETLDDLQGTYNVRLQRENIRKFFEAEAAKVRGADASTTPTARAADAATTTGRAE